MWEIWLLEGTEAIGMEVVLEMTLPRNAESAPLVRHTLDASLRGLGVGSEIRADIALALGEACANVIQHAEAGMEYEVRARMDGARCVVEVIDGGAAAEVADEAFADEVVVDEALTDEALTDEALTDEAFAGEVVAVEAVAPAGSGAAEPGAGAGSGAGAGWGAAQAPPLAEHGRGLQLMRAFTEDLHIADRVHRNGAIVHFEKSLAG
ncbi:ATP-binding protein [Actinomadura sp. GTD37]|uniref:ATP-binding protein n=1 Tax=Actinomadura sp. GTD37 TaxID=1778030 RepID=UPI0035C207B5